MKRTLLFSLIYLTIFATTLPTLDSWQVSRDEQGNIVIDAKKFPNGMKALADYVHSVGLKFGLYSDAGTKTCAGRPGSRGYELQDARQYAAWGWTT